MTITCIRRALEAALLVAALAPLGLAQMGGGMGGGMMGPGEGQRIGGTGTTTLPNGGMMGGGSGVTGGGMMGSSTSMMVAGGGMGDMMDGPVVGSNGTAYVLRRTVTVAAGASTVKNELVAINPGNGSTAWALQIDGTMFSEPVLSGSNIFLTTSEPSMGGLRLGAPTIAPVPPARKPALVIISASGALVKRVDIAADMLSRPRVAPDGTTVYVMAQDMPDTSSASGSTSLYGFGPDGTQKFKVQLATW